ncbi:MAG: VWA domain-containing protein [Phycisphaerales bacterium]|nr:VWA domain-containing protein [Phycisphaerales bacterium]
MRMGAGRTGRLKRRRGVVAVQVAVMLVVLTGFAALTIDVGVIYNTRQDLQRTADAAALAAAAMLSDYSEGNPIGVATAAAEQFTAANHVFGGDVTLDADMDVVFGQASLNSGTGQYDFVETQAAPNAVRVTVRKTADSPNGAAQLFFARVFGMNESDVSARATAVMVPRDIAVVADLSASHTDDSELGHYQLTDINLYDVWDDWPGGIDDGGGSIWDEEQIPDEWWNEEGGAPQAAGPAWGYLKELGYGTEDITSDYNPTTDPGLVYLKYNTNWSNAALTTYMTDRGYSSTERSWMNSASYDSSYYKYRVAVALGLADWSSGKTGGLWVSKGYTAGDGDDKIESGELVWLETINGRSVANSKTLWLNWIQNYVKSNNTEMYYANSNFRYRFGVKTLMNYFLEDLPYNDDMPELADTREQPMQSVKDATEVLTTYISGLESDDQMSLEIYGETAHHEVNLTMDVQQVSDRLTEMQAAYYDGWTNMGGGMAKGITELTGSRARGASRKVMLLLTDGYANVNADGGTGDYSGGEAYALAEAQEAADLGIQIYCVSVGAYCNIELMDSIAEIGGGQHYAASDADIEDYSAQLIEIFEIIGGKRPVELIE